MSRGAKAGRRSARDWQGSARSRSHTRTPGPVAYSDWQDYPLAPERGPHTVAGTLKVLPAVESPQLRNRRDILAHLPPSYGRDPRRRYPVLYMHDGQNLFDEATSYSGEWRVDETMEAASRAGREAIVIGIPSMGAERVDEYSPFRDPRHGGGRGELYLDFLVHTLKPRVDRDLRTLPDREHTGILGSSMGALISLYGFFRHARVFGSVGAMSPAFWFAHRAIFDALRDAPYVPGRIYLDVGTREGAVTLRDARWMRALLHRKGYDAEHELRYVEEAGAHHSEAAWAARLPRALEFLLPLPIRPGPRGGFRRGFPSRPERPNL